jgi:hypothetical protein
LLKVLISVSCSWAFSSAIDIDSHPRSFPDK